VKINKEQSNGCDRKFTNSSCVVIIIITESFLGLPVFIAGVFLSYDTSESKALL